MTLFKLTTAPFSRTAVLLQKKKGSNNLFLDRMLVQRKTRLNNKQQNLAVNLRFFPLNISIGTYFRFFKIQMPYTER